MTSSGGSVRLTKNEREWLRAMPAWTRCDPSAIERKHDRLIQILDSPQANWLVMESWAQALEGDGAEVYAGQVRILANAIREALG